MFAVMTESLDELERHIDELRAEVRRATMAGDHAGARDLRVELRRVERAWDEALAAISDASSESPPRASPASDRGPLLPTRELVHQVLTLVSVPAAPKLIVTVHEAFFSGELAAGRLASLRRDEERSFRSTPHARPYYLCPALTADRLAPARGLLAVSTWPMARRVVGPLSPRVDFLITAIRIAERLCRLREPGLPAMRLLWRLAANIPNAVQTFDTIKADEVAEAARAELEIHRDADQSHRDAAAVRAQDQLSEVQQLFGAPLGLVQHAATET